MTGVLYRLARILRAPPLRGARRLAARDGRARRSCRTGSATTRTTTSRCRGPTASGPPTRSPRRSPTRRTGRARSSCTSASGKLTDSEVREAVERSGRRRGEGAERRVGGQPAHAAGRLGAQQGPGDRLPVGDARRSARRAVGRRRADDHRRGREPGQGGGARGGDRRPARPEGVQARPPSRAS